MRDLKLYTDRILNMIKAAEAYIERDDPSSAMAAAASAGAYLDLFSVAISQSATEKAVQAVQAPPATQPRTRKKRGLTALLRPTLEGIQTGGTAYFKPVSGYNSRELQAAVSSYASHNWGKGSATTEVLEGGIVHIARK